MDARVLDFLLSAIPGFAGVYQTSEFKEPNRQYFAAILENQSHWVVVGRTGQKRYKFDSAELQRGLTCGLFAIVFALSIAAGGSDDSKFLSENRTENDLLALSAVKEWKDRLER